MAKKHVSESGMLSKNTQTDELIKGTTKKKPAKSAHLGMTALRFLCAISYVSVLTIRAQPNIRMTLIISRARCILGVLRLTPTAENAPRASRNSKTAASIMASNDPDPRRTPMSGIHCNSASATRTITGFWSATTTSKTRTAALQTKMRQLKQSHAVRLLQNVARKEEGIERKMESFVPIMSSLQCRSFDQKQSKHCDTVGQLRRKTLRTQAELT
jgi:hypothetical protein